MKVLIIDNYDSFTFNLYQYIGEILSKTGKPFILDVIKNDEFSFQVIQKRNYNKIIISPGPGDPANPSDVGICAKVVRELGKTTPILGVCLGMQAIAHYFGGKVIRAAQPMHGKTSLISNDEKGVFTNIPQLIPVMRYHSLLVDRDSLPKDFVITAVAKDTNEIMGIRHRDYPLEGVQFHPESFATESGKVLLANFLTLDNISLH